MAIIDLNSVYLQTYFKNPNNFEIEIGAQEIKIYNKESPRKEFAKVLTWRFFDELLKYAKITEYEFVE